MHADREAVYDFFINSLPRFYRDRFQIRAVLKPRNSFAIRRCSVRDLVYIAITIAFFLVSIAYVHFCDRLK